jgi:hypothetical protein
MSKKIYLRHRVTTDEWQSMGTRRDTSGASESRLCRGGGGRQPAISARPRRCNEADDGDDHGLGAAVPVVGTDAEDFSIQARSAAP